MITVCDMNYTENSLQCNFDLILQLARYVNTSKDNYHTTYYLYNNNQLLDNDNLTLADYRWAIGTSVNLNYNCTQLSLKLTKGLSINDRLNENP